MRKSSFIHNLQPAGKNMKSLVLFHTQKKGTGIISSISIDFFWKNLYIKAGQNSSSHVFYTAPALI